MQAVDLTDVKGYGHFPWVREAKWSFLVSSQCSIVQEKSGQCHARFLPASCLTHLALINSWLTGTERFFFFSRESFMGRGGYELTALLAHNLVFRKHLRVCVCDIGPALGFLKVA